MSGNKLYLSAWATTGTAGLPFYNEANRRHPVEELAERIQECSDDGWILLWFTEIEENTAEGYYKWCADENAGELGERV